MRCGSSPRVRRTPLRGHQGCRYGRFISACAENAPELAASSIPVSVHLRVCGERKEWLNANPSPAGSSPRVRRTRTRNPCLCTARRFISACAENAFIALAASRISAVHLRVCGERIFVSSDIVVVSGSSPRVRRTRRLRGFRQWRRRFISACAENAPNSTCCTVVTPVHLRVCGERRTVLNRNRAICGSSPRVRRTLPQNIQAEQELRFISACAENALARKRMSYNIFLQFQISTRFLGLEYSEFFTLQAMEV